MQVKSLFKAGMSVQMLMGGRTAAHRPGPDSCCLAIWKIQLTFEWVPLGMEEPYCCLHSPHLG